MSNNQNDNYANLPDELLEDILEDAPKIADKIKPLFNELQQKKRFSSTYYAKLSAKCQNNKALFLKLLKFLKPKPQRSMTLNTL
ncbi:MAG: hypothetical protein AB4060_21270 [Crocosphaera sp.]